MTTQLDVSLNFSGGGLTFSAEGLPPGLSIDPTTGIVFGTPTAVGASTVTVTAANESGQAFASFSWRIEAASLPVNTAAPEILGTAAIGGNLTAEPSSWTGQPEPTFGYQWLHNGVAIPGETSEAYLATAADVGASLSVEVTASNGLGAASATSNPVIVSTVSFGTELTLAPFATGPGGAAPIFSGRREQNSGLVFVSGAGEPGEIVQGRMVRASDGAAVSSWMDIATADAGDGSFEGWIEGAPRSFDALRAQVRYKEAGNAPASTSNACFIGWVMSLFAQSDQRWLGDTNFEGVSLTPTVALVDNAVRVITLQRDALTPAPVNAANLLVFDVAGSPVTGRDPVWRFANTLVEVLTDGPIVVMGHAVSGTNDRQTVNDSDDGRFWKDEVLIAQAGQPHLVETDRPVALDLVYWAYSSSANYTTSAQALGITGRIAFGVDPSGAPVAPGASITEFGGSFNYIQNHSWAEIYDWRHSRLAFREHPNPPVVEAQKAFIGHPVYGQYVLGFPSVFSPAWLTNGTRNPDGTWFDAGHASNNQVGGFSEIAALAAAGMAYAVGVLNPGDIMLDYIAWPTEPGDDPKYVHVGIEGRDITTMRELYAAENPPVEIGGDQVLGGVLGFTVNGTRTIDTALVTHEGFRRIRVGKQDGSDWTNADVLAYDPPTINYVGLPPDPGADDLKDTLARFLDFPIVESGLATKPGLPLLGQVKAGLFTNPLPASAVSYTVVEHAAFSGITAGSPGNLTTITGHDGSPLIIFVATSSASGSDAGYPNAATLGGNSIHPQTVRWASSAFKLNLYHVASPGTGDLDLDIGYGANANGGTFMIVRVDAGKLGLPPTVAASGGATITTMAPGVASPQGGSTALHLIMASGPTTGGAPGGAGGWDDAAVEFSGSHWTRLGVVEDVGGGSASGFSVSFSPSQRVLHASTFVRPPST